MKTAMFMLLAVVAGLVVPFQSIVNGRLGILTENRFLSALISFTGGTVVLALMVLITSKGLPTLPAGTKIPWYLCTGGLLGAVFVTVVLTVVPSIGTARVLAAALMGQLLMSLVIDHYGMLGIPKDPVTFTRVLGCLLLLGGTILIQMKS